MKFILMMHAPWGKTGDWEILKWPPGAIEKHMECFTKLNDELKKNGELVAIDGLAPPKEARLVKANAKGGPPITDGPFAESKEFLAGWWVVDVASAERAYEIAARASAAPGPDGKPLHMGIEVRQIMSGPSTK